jgi:hypothetical protein
MGYTVEFLFPRKPDLWISSKHGWKRLSLEEVGTPF